MKSMKGRFLKKLNFIPSISTLKQGLVSHLNSTESFSYQNLQIPPIYIQEDHKKDILAGSFGVSKHKTESKDEELDLELNFVDKVNIATSVLSNDRVPAMDSPEAPVSTEITVEQDTENEAEKEIEEHPSLSDFEEKCLPGGSQSVILYTTSLRSIRKTFEDCHAIRFLLESFKVIFHEKDVSLHLEFREELWRIMGDRVIPPRLFIKGRYIGGADEVTGLHEQGKLKNLLAGIPLNLSNCPCTGCGNIRFIVCSDCNGSRKVFADDQNDETYIRCPECNENGLVKCLICS
jgi:glutaredoxin domain-containing cysteine-rich protein 1